MNWNTRNYKPSNIFKSRRTDFAYTLCIAIFLIVVILGADYIAETLSTLILTLFEKI